MSPPVFRIIRGQEDLRDRDIMTRQCILPRMGQLDLSRGRRGLTLIQPQDPVAGSAGKTEHTPSHGDRSRRTQP